MNEETAATMEALQAQLAALRAPSLAHETRGAVHALRALAEEAKRWGFMEGPQIARLVRAKADALEKADDK